MVADLWHNLEESEWARLGLLRVPAKLLKKDQGDQRAWQQYKVAQQCAGQRADQEAPRELLQPLQEADKWHGEVYQAAAGRIAALMQDKDHYMLCTRS